MHHHEAELEILRLLREATGKGLIHWKQSPTNEDHYFTVPGPLNTYIQFKWVAFNGEVGSDRDFVEVGGAGHHMAGSPGWWLATEILAAGNVAYWRQHNANILDAFEQKVALLQQLLSRD